MSVRTRMLALGLATLILSAGIVFVPLPSSDVELALKFKPKREILESPPQERVPAPSLNGDSGTSSLQIITLVLSTIGRETVSIIALIANHLNLPGVDSLAGSILNFGKEGFVGGEFAWNHDPLTVSIRLSSNADPSAVDLVKAAILDWQDRIRGRAGSVSAPRDSAPFGIRFVSSSSAADIIITLAERVDPALGYTKVFSTNSRVDRAEATISTRTAMGLPLDKADVQNIAAHEFGHALGLGHSASFGDVMHGSYDFIGTSRVIRPSTCEVDRIIGIYLKDGSGFSAPNSSPQSGLFTCTSG